MKTISINFQIPASWSELSDKQLRKVYELIASDSAECSRFSCEEIKILCLLQWSDTKVVGKQPSGAYLLRKGKQWGKEEELKQLKSDLAALDRKITAQLAPKKDENDGE